MAQKLPVLVLVRDLIFATRIDATARAEGVTITLLRVPSRLRDAEGTRLILDLNEPGALDAAIAWKIAAPAQGPKRQIVGYVSHVDTHTIKRARTAGVDRILPRSRFVEELTAILRG